MIPETTSPEAIREHYLKMIDVQISAWTSPSDLLTKFQDGQRIIFAGNTHLKFAVGSDTHSDLEFELDLSSYPPVTGSIKLEQGNVNWQDSLSPFLEKIGITDHNLAIEIENRVRGKIKNILKIRE